MIDLDNPDWLFVGQGSYGEVYRLAGTNLAIKVIMDVGKNKFDLAVIEFLRGFAVRKSKYAPKFYGVLPVTYKNPDFVASRNPKKHYVYATDGHVSEKYRQTYGILIEYVGNKTNAVIKYSRFKYVLHKANKDFAKYGYEIFDPNIDNFRVIRNKKGGISKFWYVDMGGIRKI